LLALLPVAAAAQDALPVTRISASAKDARFQVDGSWFIGSALFTWPAGSKHVLTTYDWQYAYGNPKARYVFRGWNTAAGPLASLAPSATITADPAIPWYNAELTTQYAVSLVFFRCGDPPCDGPGTVWVNFVAPAGYSQDTDVWIDAGSTVSLQAVPSPGYLFTGWLNGPSAPLFSLVLNAPVTVYPTFARARPVQLGTVPGGLQLLADRAPVYPPLELEWGWNTVHTLSAPSPQRDALHGRLWVLQSWSDGGAASHTYPVEPGIVPVSVVATFAPAVTATVLTEPAGLMLTGDGQDVASPHNWYWAPGETHTLAAPARQTDAAGGSWVFRAWSNGAPNPQTVLTTADEADTGFRATAIYDPLSRIHVDSVPTGLTLTADGAACKTPCELERNVGATVRLSAPASLAAGSGARLDFGSWEGTDSATFTAAAGFHKVTAHYFTSYSLSLGTSVDNAGSWQVSPPAGDGYYREGTAVTVGFRAADGMRFDGWELDLSGAANPASLAMDGPRSVRAVVNRLPASPPPPSVVNAAGVTPVAGVAAGSLASVFGDNLAAAPAQSQSVPLPQSLGGVAMLCGAPCGGQGGSRYLALLFVSPQQINFQVPGDLKPGSYTLEIHRADTPVRPVAFEVMRDAPGLFAAAHQDGGLITSDSPAARGETILVFGTGFGPYQTALPDGFPAPSAPALTLVDDTSVLLGDRSISPEFAGAVPGGIGVAMIRVTLPSDLTDTPTASLAVKSGGQFSNTLALPCN